MKRQNKLLPLFAFIFIIGTGFNNGKVSSTGNHTIDTTNRGAFKWYNNSYIHTHASVNFQVADTGYLGRQIDKVKPDVVQFHVNAPFWEVLNATKFYNRHGFKMAAVINHAGTWINSLYDNSDKYAYRVNADGTFAGRWDKKHLCLNSPGVDEVIIPEFYYQLPKKIKPAQIWIDESVITINICYCKFCKALYKKQYHAEPPVKLTDTNWAEWEQWVGFHRKTFENWMEKVYKAIKKADPKILVTFNHAYFIEQPEKPPYFINNLSADIFKDPLELGIYARYGGSGTLPFDLMPGLGTDIWAGVKPKTVEDIYNEISLIIAHGGKWDIGEFPTNFTSVRKEDLIKGYGKRDADKYVWLAEKGTAFARARQPFCQNTKSLKYAALLHSASTHYAHVIANANTVNNGTRLGITSDGTIIKDAAGRINSRIYWPDNLPFSDDMIGAYEALIENHIQFDIINEDELREQLQDYKLLVLPEQAQLQPETMTAIRRFIKNGGRVVASGATVISGLEEVFGVQPLSKKPAGPGVISTNWGAITVKNTWAVQNKTGTVLAGLANATAPALISNNWGNGKTFYIANNLFNLYADRCGFSFNPKGDERLTRGYVKGIFKAAAVNNPFNVSANPWMETTLREDGKYVYLHIINRGSNWKQVRPAPAADTININLALTFQPKKVLLQPDGQRLTYHFANGRLSFSIPENSVGIYQIVQIIK